MLRPLPLLWMVTRTNHESKSPLPLPLVVEHPNARRSAAGIATNTTGSMIAHTDFPIAVRVDAAIAVRWRMEAAIDQVKT